MKWTPVTERLPRSYETVIVATSKNMVTTAFMTINQTWIYLEGKELYVEAEVTAWMPLPEPYKEEDRHNGKL